MLIYQSTKNEFMNHVTNDEITKKIYDKYLEKVGKTSKQEIESWTNSMNYMYKVLNTDEIPNESGVAIEYKVPATSKRIDFILTGRDNNNKEHGIIIELKQWSDIEKVEGKDGIVKTRFKHGIVETTHPSYQAWTYAVLLSEYNENIQESKIELFPCAYLHNYYIKENDPLIDKVYFDYLNHAPVYTKGDVLKLRHFIKKYITKPDYKEVLYKIDNGKIRPSKSLQDSLLKMLDGNQEFLMIDDQKLAYETALSLANNAFTSEDKKILIVEGGPGTGKSVLAINLLVNLIAQDRVCQYVTKNSAPRYVYVEKLQQKIKRKVIEHLFKGSGVYVSAESNEFDALIVDEAHRLNEKSGMFKNKGENQTKEIINASKFSVFFIDELQKVTIHDVGSKEEIIKYAKEFGAEVTVMKLESQFRCNGSDGYLSWLNDVLHISETANFDGFDFEYDFKIFDNPHELYELIKEKNKMNNKARMVAGYCWDWNKEGKSKTDVHDIQLQEYDFSMSWNLFNSTTWAIDSESVNEAGCIHTCQGLEFDYVGVIIGDDLRYENDKIITDFTKRARTDQSLRGIKKISKTNLARANEIADNIIKNTYRTLMTRGQKGCYVYCTDKNLSNYLKQRLNHMAPKINRKEVQNQYLKAAEESEKYNVDKK